jgi:hypothetical protein
MTPNEAISQKAYVLGQEWAYWVAFYNSVHCNNVSLVKCPVL